MQRMQLIFTACLLGLLAVAAPAAAQSAATQASSKDPVAPSRSRLPDKETLTILSAVVALLGTAVPMVAKGFESVSSATRRKRDLQRIEELTSLMEKIKKENILTSETQAEVSTQIEAEIKATLNQLGRNRELREKASVAREKARVIKAAGSAAELPLWRRITMLYMPNGVLAWIAQPIFYFWTVVAISAAAVGDFDAALGSLVFMVPACLVAWYARRRWEKTQAAVESSAPREPAADLAPAAR